MIALLVEAFDGFPGEDPPSGQGGPSPHLRVFAAFLDAAWPPAAAALRATLRGEGRARVAFFARYGCVLLCASDDGAARVALQLLCPDRWGLRVAAEGGRVSAAPTNEAALFCGWVATWTRFSSTSTRGSAKRRRPSGKAARGATRARRPAVCRGTK